jgi:hypothetical protein
MMVELTAQGVRDTGIWFPYGTKLAEGLSVRDARESSSSYEIFQRDVTSIDGSGNPVYGPERLIARAPLAGPGGRNPIHGPCAVDAQEPTFGQTSTGVVVTFDPCAFANDGYDPSGLHLGGIALGESDFRFRASPGGSFTLQGSGNDALIVDGEGISNLNRLQHNYAASVAMSAGRQIVYNYFGEFWNNGQANQFMHWLDDGLFIGQFGTPNYPGVSKRAVLAGAAGNTFSPVMVIVDGNFYVYHNDESAHAGVHRWRLANMGSLQEMVAAIGKKVEVQNPPSVASTAINPY